jgi:hypothetical protein
MQKRSIEHAWKVVLAVVALTATAMALYVLLFERKTRQEDDRVSAARLEEALAESRAEILAQLRAEAAKRESAEQPGDQPLPNTVMRRGESGGRGLQPVLDSRDTQEAALARLQESLASLERQVEHSDRTLRRDLEELRAGVRREQDLSSKALGLLLVALIPLILHFLASLWTRWDGKGGEGER